MVGLALPVSALPAAAGGCGAIVQDAAAAGDSSGPLVVASVSGDTLTWTAVPGATVDSVAVETAAEGDGSAELISALALYAGGAGGSFVVLPSTTSIRFSGSVACPELTVNEDSADVVPAQPESPADDLVIETAAVVEQPAPASEEASPGGAPVVEVRLGRGFSSVTRYAI